MKAIYVVLLAVFVATCGFAQTSSEGPGPVTMKQLMVDLVHPASNDILLSIYRGGPKDDAEWAAVRRSAVALAESGTLLMLRGRARDQGEWAKDVTILVDAGNAAYSINLRRRKTRKRWPRSRLRSMPPALPATGNIARTCILGKHRDESYDFLPHGFQTIPCK